MKQRRNRRSGKPLLEWISRLDDGFHLELHQLMLQLIHCWYLTQILMRLKHVDWDRKMKMRCWRRQDREEIQLFWCVVLFESPFVWECSVILKSKHKSSSWCIEFHSSPLEWESLDLILSSSYFSCPQTLPLIVLTLFFDFRQSWPLELRREHQMKWNENLARLKELKGPTKRFLKVAERHSPLAKVHLLDLRLGSLELERFDCSSCWIDTRFLKFV